MLISPTARVTHIKCYTCDDLTGYIANYHCQNPIFYFSYPPYPRFKFCINPVVLYIKLLQCLKIKKLKMSFFLPINLLLLPLLLATFTFAGALDVNYCLSWRLSVETNNLRDWKLVPKECAAYVRTYMEGGQYRRDCDAMADDAIQFAKSVKVRGDGKDIWIFDIDETALSNLPFYARPDVGFG